MWSLSALVCCVVLFPALVQAQTYTWRLLAIPDPTNPSAMVNIEEVTNGDVLLGRTRRLAYRISPTRDLDVIQCPQHNPTAARLSPDITGINNARTVAGTEEVLVAGHPALRGILQTADGTCTTVHVGGTTATLLTAVADDESSAGWYVNPATLEPGLRSRHGFVRAADGTFSFVEGLCLNEALHPETRNTAGTMTGYAYCEITPTNAYRYAAWALRAGQWQELRDPSGQPLWVPLLNNNDLALGVTAKSERTIGGAAWFIDLKTTPPTFTPLPFPPPQQGGTIVSVIPRGLNDLGWFVVTATEQLAACVAVTNPCSVSHQFLAIPETPPPPTTRQHFRHWRAKVKWLWTHWHGDERFPWVEAD